MRSARSVRGRSLSLLRDFQYLGTFNRLRFVASNAAQHTDGDGAGDASSWRTSRRYIRRPSWDQNIPPRSGFGSTMRADEAGRFAMEPRR
jgi:hypothetical protein